MSTPWLVVGAGFAGAVFARRLADAGQHVLVIDRREHAGGNAFDELDPHGIRVHRYGPHIFHTNAEQVRSFLSRFTAWRPYEHRVLAQVGGRLYPIPINRTTINSLYGLDLDEAGVRAFYERVREPRNPVLTSEDAVVNAVGWDLFEKFFRNYTRKQWGLEPAQLSAAVAARIPFRANGDDRYFTDSFQAMPQDGYAELFRNLLDDAKIRLELGTDFFAVRARVRPQRTVYTGPLDAYFDFSLGRLPYRSLQFRHEHYPERAVYQAVGTVNFPNDHAYTRSTEFKHLTGQRASGTSVVFEYPCAEGEPYYPVPCPESAELAARYHRLASAEREAIFVGRLAQYRYYNMDQAVAAALAAAAKVIGD